MVYDEITSEKHTSEHRCCRFMGGGGAEHTGPENAGLESEGPHSRGWQMLDLENGGPMWTGI